MTTTETSSQVQQWTNLAQQLRVDSIRATTAAGSGHPTSSMSAADLMSVLLVSYLHYDFDNPGNPNNDHLIFSKGHASPLLYSVFKAVGVVSDEELMTRYRRFGSRLEGHPTPELPWVDVATGSLGQGLPDAVGARAQVDDPARRRRRIHGAAEDHDGVGRWQRRDGCDGVSAGDAAQGGAVCLFAGDRQQPRHRARLP